MNFQVLYSLKDGIYKDSGIFFCSNCKIVYKRAEDAEECCKCLFCNKLIDEKRANPSSLQNYHNLCWEIKTRADREKFDDRNFAKATKITAKEWAKNEHSWIFSESYLSNDGYCDINDFIDQFGEDGLFCPNCGEEPEAKALDTKEDKDNYLECKCGWKSPPYEVVEDIIELFLPKYVWAAEFEPVKLDFYSIIERVEENHYEGLEVNGTKELEAAIDKFNEDNKNNGSYNVNYKIVITNLEELL